MTQIADHQQHIFHNPLFRNYFDLYENSNNPQQVGCRLPKSDRNYRSVRDLHGTTCGTYLGLEKSI